MEKIVNLKLATRNELIRELFTRESITSIQVNEGEVAKIETKYGNVSVDGQSNIFVIAPIKTNKNCPLLVDKIHISQDVTFDKKENITIANSDDKDLASKDSNAVNKSIHQNFDPSKHSLLITSNGNNIRVFVNGVEPRGLREVNFKYKINEAIEINITQLALPNN